MHGFGRFATYPRKLGGGVPRQQIILEALQTDNGTAYSTDDQSPHYVEDLATARAISATWGTNYRLGSLWRPYSMPSEMLPRWERILSLVPAPDATEASRRDAIGRILANFGEASNSGRLTELLQRQFADIFVAVESISSSMASITVPDGTWPFGTASSAFPWSSTVARVLVRVQCPSAMSESGFYSAVAGIAPLLDQILPAWVTIDWYRPGPISVVVSGGPSAGGFYLDDDHNLDNEVFDV